MDATSGTTLRRRASGAFASDADSGGGNDAPAGNGLNACLRDRHGQAKKSVFWDASRRASFRATRSFDAPGGEHAGRSVAEIDILETRFRRSLDCR